MLFELIKKDKDNFSDLENVYCYDKKFLDENIDYCQMCVCNFIDNQKTLTYNSINLLGEIEDDIIIKHDDVILLKYYNNNKLIIEIINSHSNNFENYLKNFYTKKLNYDTNFKNLKISNINFFDYIKLYIY